MHVPNPQHTVGNVQPPPAAAEPGNQRARRHGAYSAMVGERVRELADDVLDANAHLDATRDGAAVVRYAVLLARVGRVYEWLSRQPDDVFADAEAGTPHAIYDRLARWESQCAAAERALTIDPLTRAKLKLTQAQAIDAATALSAAREEPDPTLRRAILERAGLIDPPTPPGIAVSRGDEFGEPDPSRTTKSGEGDSNG
jgi:hypothetical protein